MEALILNNILLLYYLIYTFVNTLCFILKLGYLGIEPRAYQLKAEYSTIELVTLININFNTPGLAGIEPVTFALTGQHSNHSELQSH
jgi:hypothetical protein